MQWLVVLGLSVQGSTKRLIKAVLQEEARKPEMRYSDKKVRRHFHDDITVIVVFLNYELTSKSHSKLNPRNIF